MIDLSGFANRDHVLVEVNNSMNGVVIINGGNGNRNRKHFLACNYGGGWSVCDDGRSSAHADMPITAILGKMDVVVAEGEDDCVASDDFTDRLSTIEQQLADIKVAQNSSAELLMLASRLIDAIDGKPPQQANPSLCSDAGVVSFSVNPSVRTLDLIKALGNAVATFGLRLECSYNSKLVVYEIKIEMPQ